jgi:predicted O-methyltransferase YrrM
MFDVFKPRRIKADLQWRWMKKARANLMVDMKLSDAVKSFSTRNELYAYMHHYFHNMCSLDVQNHRKYFLCNQRGFGEDAFHAMWYMLLRDFKPKNCLEIGVYRGQVISLWALLALKFNFSCDVYGISPFTSAGDSVSSYLEDIDYMDDTIKNHSVFGLSRPNLLRAFSTDAEAKVLMESKNWDLIYIDGGHDYDTALSDYELSKINLAVGGVLIMDDSSLYTDFHPPKFSFGGHPGPSAVVKEKAFQELQFLGAVGHNNIFIKI